MCNIFLLFSNDEAKAVEFKVRNENMDKWEIPRDHIIFKESIGHGAFGVVWRARLSQPYRKLGIQTVAVKCFTRKLHWICIKLFSALDANSNISISFLKFSHFAASSGEEGRKALMREIELGKLFGETEQPIVIKFIGSVSTEGKYRI